MEPSGSRYVDYSAGGRYNRGEDAPYSSYDDSYDPPERPPRKERSHERSVEKLNRRERSQERLDRRERSQERLDRRERSQERLDRRDRSVDRLERRDRSIDRSLDRGVDRSLGRPDRRERDIERGFEGRNRSYEHLEVDNSSYDRRSADRKNKSLDRLDRRNEGVDQGLEVATKSVDRRHRSRDSNMDGRSMDRRSRSRDHLPGQYPDQVWLHPGSAAPSERAESEFTVRNETQRSRAVDEEERRAASRAASEIYATTRFPVRPQSEMSQYTYRSGRGGSDIMSVKTKTAAGGKLVMETMTAPHPCCPNTRSCCCLMILLNLSMLLITLGFVVVLQLYDPPFVWYVGLSMLIFGFLVLFGSMIYCVFVCREVEKMRPPPGELYWTNHWSKTVHVPEIHYSNQQTRPADYRGSEFSYKTEPSRLTNGNNTSSSLTRY